MAKAPKTVDEYIAGHPDDVQAVLRRVRGILRKALPGAEEGLGYRIPVYRQHGTYVVYFAGWKRHYSLYPASSRLVKAFGEDLAPYVVSKGTIRLPLDRPVRARLIERIAKFLAREAAQRVRAKPARGKKRT
jgi:uncharacterized protein YdhG (YjbR/CyaY superfamily)